VEHAKLTLVNSNIHTDVTVKMLLVNQLSTSKATSLRKYLRQKP